MKEAEDIQITHYKKNYVLLQKEDLDRFIMAFIKEKAMIMNL